jgi:hypothetical protein
MGIKQVTDADRQSGGLVVFLREFPQVQTIEDSLARVIIHVTPVDRESATPFEQKACALAKACERELEVDGAFIGLSRSYLVKGIHAIRFKTPDSVAREVVTFDRHEDFATGTYHLAPMNPSSRFGTARTSTGRRRNTNRGPQQQMVVHRTTRVREG